jgi:hypothetical protein
MVNGYEPSAWSVCDPLLSSPSHDGVNAFARSVHFGDAISRPPPSVATISAPRAATADTANNTNVIFFIILISFIASLAKYRKNHILA